MIPLLFIFTKEEIFSLGLKEDKVKQPKRTKNLKMKLRRSDNLLRGGKQLGNLKKKLLRLVEITQMNRLFKSIVFGKNNILAVRIHKFWTPKQKFSVQLVL
jgi:hypothetical protein